MPLFYRVLPDHFRQLIHRYTLIMRRQLQNRRRDCLLCLAPCHTGLALCAPCHAELPLPGPACTLCADPLPRTIAVTGPLLCGHCIQQRPAFDRCYSALLYEAPVDTLVSGFKYKKRMDLARLLATLMARQAVAQQWYGADADCIVPVPLHWWKLQQRGFNQSAVAARLARADSRVTGSTVFPPLRSRIVKRVRATPSQTGRDRAGRARNIRGAFKVRAATVPARILLIDDVVTTGATVNELARALKSAGAEEVVVWSLARTPGLHFS